MCQMMKADHFLEREDPARVLMVAQSLCLLELDSGRLCWHTFSGVAEVTG